jgi:PiT family inorganic phosphate transporter
LREYIKSNYAVAIHEIELHHDGSDRQLVEDYLAEFKKASMQEKSWMLKELKKSTVHAELSKDERKALKQSYRSELVKRSALLKIAAAWVITVPAAAIMAALIFFTIRGMMLP